MTSTTARVPAAPPPPPRPQVSAQTRVQQAVAKVRPPAPPRPAAPGQVPQSAPAGGRPPRKARLRLMLVDPWSVMKTAFLLSVAMGIVTLVAVLIVWTVLGSAGVWDSVNESIRGVIGDQASKNFDIEDYIGTSRVLGFTALVAVIDVVLLTALATLSAFLYNMAAALLGGLEVTLVEDS
ncbi:MAG: DUF3566 domain-containing protein [Nocardioides sp.]